MTDIYTQHYKAFINVSAWVILKDGKRVATVAVKFPKDGAGRVYAYVHWLGVPMVRGFVHGYGYGKPTAAIANAVKPFLKSAPGDGNASQGAFGLILTQDEGKDWTYALENAGFTVMQAV